jgi:hypothetical protein
LALLAKSENWDSNPENSQNAAKSAEMALSSEVISREI